MPRPEITDEYKKKVAKGVKKAIEEGKLSGKETYKAKMKQTETPESFVELNNRTRQKIVKRLRDNDLINGCVNCGWGKAICDIHHTKGRDEENCHQLNKLVYICPNCHRLAHKNIIDDQKLKTLEEMVGDKWKKYYYWYPKN